MDPLTTQLPTTPAPPTTPFPFLSLPSELRIMIYEYVLIRPNMKIYEWLYQRLCREHNLLALARTCKQLHNEAMPVFFGKNLFDFSDTNSMAGFLSDLSNDRPLLIRKVRFDFKGTGRNKAFTLLGDCLELETLEIEIHSDTTLRSRRDRQRDLFAGHGLKKLVHNVRGCKEVTVTYPSGNQPHVKRHTAENSENFMKYLKAQLCRE